MTIVSPAARSLGAPGFELPLLLVGAFCQAGCADE
jgi:hypothetical protein